MHAGNDKKLNHQAPKVQVVLDPLSQIHSNIPRATVQQKTTKRNPLLPISRQQPTKTQQVISKQPSQPKNASSYQFTGKLDNIDERCVDDPLCATDYVEDMYDLFRKKEGLTAVLPDYMESTQSHINEKMRSILVDWLVEVHMKFKLDPETLFLTINLIDRYLERKEVTRPKLQLVGVGCLFIATKYEEIYPPSVSDLVYICDNAYSRQNVSLSLCHFVLLSVRISQLVLTTNLSFVFALSDHQNGNTDFEDFGIPNHATICTHIPRSLLEGRSCRQRNVSTCMLLVGRDPLELLDAKLPTKSVGGSICIFGTTCLWTLPMESDSTEIRRIP